VRSQAHTADKMNERNINILCILYSWLKMWK